MLVREYMMLLLLERKNLRFKEYLQKCALEEKLGEVLFEPREDSQTRHSKLRLLQQYNDLLGRTVCAEGEPGHRLQDSGRLGDADGGTM